VSHHQPYAAQPATPSRKPPPAWWWLPEQERRRRREQRRAWKRANARRARRRRDNDCCDGCDCLGELADPCLIALMPVVLASALRAALPGRRAVRDADPAAPVPSGALAAALYAGVRQYRTRISPGRPACCPYTPSCSTYAVQALHRHGALRGTRLTAARLLRCRPGTKGGPDPVPGR